MPSCHISIPRVVQFMTNYVNCMVCMSMYALHIEAYRCDVQKAVITESCGFKSAA